MDKGREPIKRVITKTVSSSVSRKVAPSWFLTPPTHGPTHIYDRPRLSKCYQPETQISVPLPSFCFSKRTLQSELVLTVKTFMGWTGRGLWSFNLFNPSKWVWFSPYSTPGLPWTPDPPTFSSQVLGLEMWISTTGLINWCFEAYYFCVYGVLCVCLHLYLCIHAMRCGCLWRVDNGVRSLGLQVVVNCLVWVSGTKPGSFGGEHEALKEKDSFCF